MPNKDIFCNTPWYELQIYWDGGLGACCQEAHRIYPLEKSSTYNIANMTIAEWFNSQPMVSARQQLLGNTKLSICERCYIEEEYSPSSRRHRSNQKSVIFTKDNFKESFKQSPGYKKFASVTAIEMPIDLHIDLGNYCNLACKMCSAKASSSIAVQEVKWGIEKSRQYIGSDWTRNKEVWDRTIAEIIAIPKLSNIHFMGGETLITPKFEELVDALILAGRTDVNISFVTNGTTFNSALLNKLTQFKRVGIEVSIESLTQHNSYQRQGTDTALVLENIDRYINEYTNNTSITVTLRPAISALTIGSYWTLLEYALQRKLLVKGLIAFTPSWIHPAVLPAEVRNEYKVNYQNLITNYQLTSNTADYNESDPTQYKEIIYDEIIQVLNLLNVPQVNGFNELVNQCRKWDNVYKYNATELYPELANEFKKYGY